MSTTLGCTECRVLIPITDAQIARNEWPPKCPACGNVKRFTAWAGSPEWVRCRQEAFTQGDGVS